MNAPLEQLAWQGIHSSPAPAARRRFLAALHGGEAEADASDAPPRIDEFDDLVALLQEHAAPACADAPWIAYAVAAGCLGDNHLWQDMGLPGRDALSALLRRYFPALAARNTGDMKWKKFFYLQLCERAEVRACRAPSCAVCCDRPRCFGDESGPALVALARLAQ